MTVALMPEISAGSMLYLASDFHLGAPDAASSLVREKKIVAWLDHVASDATDILLVGDVFDFWFEYKYAIPKGFIRFQGKLAELKDRGIQIRLFTGNHDMWMFDYFSTELGIPVHRNPVICQQNGKKFVIGHGDGLGPGDRQYKILKKIFANPACQWAFQWIHPNVGMWIAQRWSKNSRLHNASKNEDHFLGDKEYLLQYCKSELEKSHVDFFIFGHRHLPLDIDLGQGSRYINLGEWIRFYTYAKIQDGSPSLLTWS